MTDSVLGPDATAETPEAEAPESVESAESEVWFDEDWLAVEPAIKSPSSPEVNVETDQWQLEWLYTAIEALPDRGWIYRALGDFWTERDAALALGAYAQSLACDPQQPILLMKAAALAVTQGELVIAKDFCYQAIGYGPNRPEPYYNLGRMADDAGEDHPAVVLYSQALLRDPTFGPVYVRLGNAWGRLGDWPRALATYQAGTQHPKFVAMAELCARQGYALEKLGDLKGAIAAYDGAITQDSECVAYRCVLALVLLKTGQWERGWDVYEWRLQQSFYKDLIAECEPRWTGESLAGQTILVRSEQGLGDTIQFCRYLPALRKTAERLIFRGRECLRDVVMTVGGVDEFINWEQSLEAVKYDVAVPLMSVAQYWVPDPAIAAEATAAQPVYLQVPDNVPDFELPPPALETAAQKVGLVWASGYRDVSGLIEQYQRKTCDVGELMGAIARPEIQYYSLQVGRDVPAGQALYKSGQLIDLSDRLASFSETAAAIAQLDLVIAVDTAVAHLAGALGKPVWIMLPWQADWRWLRDRSDSPWYPTARLFRQAEIGDWPSVFEAVAQALDQREWDD